MSSILNNIKSKKNILVTILILVILVIFSPIIIVVILYSLDPKSRLESSGDLLRASQVNLMSSAIKLYYQDNNIYPKDLNTLVPIYVTKLPEDINDSSLYTYKSINGKDFELCAKIKVTKSFACANKYSAPIKITD